MDKKPSLVQIKSEIQHYDSVEEEIIAVQPFIHVECIELSTGMVCFR